MQVYALLTGRGNNTLKDKNILKILGHPVLYYPAKAVCDSHWITEKFCSSDDDKILMEAQKLSHIPIKRPSEYAQPNSQHIDCILHALAVMEELKKLPDILVVTLANNVSIKAQWIDECIEKMIFDPTLTAVVPVYMDNDHHPLRAKKLSEDGILQPYENIGGSSVSTNRQDLSSCYFLAHNFWVLRVENILKSPNRGSPPWSFMGNRVAAYSIDSAVDIHCKNDLLLAKEWIQQHLELTDEEDS